MRLKIKDKGSATEMRAPGSTKGKLEEGMIGKCDRSKGLWNGP